MTELLILLLLIVVNGIFSMAEIALVSARKIRLKNDAERGDTRARQALQLAEAPDTFLSTVQIGITLIGILTGIYSGEKLEGNLTEWLRQFTIIAPYANTISRVLLLVFITYITLVIGELVPKRIGLTRAESISKTLALPMSLLSRVTYPFIWLLSISTNLIVKVLGIRRGDDSMVTEEEIKAIVNEGLEQGTIDVIEQEIVENVFNVSDRHIVSLMTHRSDLAWIDINDTVEQVQQKIKQERHSVYPVGDKSLDKMIGVITVKDLYLASPGTPLKSLIHKPVFLPENISAYQVLDEFRKSKVHHGFIVDEYGVLQGMVTVNDIFEAIVGHMPDAEVIDFTFVKREDGSFLVEAQMPFIDFLTRMGRRDIRDFLEEDYSTVAGFILHHLRRIPVEGEHFRWSNLMFEVIDMDGQRIDKVLVSELTDLDE
ncbi:hemolysin family protein [Siphonobacter sp. SORGH_AS_0500]|uniref:hemolysin family protein n=1 Tax=Siphonobacter sp. SORGH_AS_0500 TaxID=1864824 RepID=UPI000CAD1A98|nr:hemolysin family protein [Siphonobacter sp. SORGH_AS_0500]MDR6196574.1 putative hemolysin [Siphonobacter sp. SORGH_AS_0500]PKK35804.1 hemolysin [Siphonobacter sp. SORGH_AS_0500]